METYVHLFWECPRIQTIWKQIANVISVRTKEKVDLDKTVFMLGLFPSELCIMNVITIIVKHYIYHAKNFHQHINATTAWLKILYHRDIAEAIATKHGKIEEYNKLWLPLVEEEFPFVID